MIAAGRLDRRVQIQAPTVTRGELGGAEETWATLATVWAQVRTLNGKETVIAQQVQSQASVVVTLRYRTDVEARQRVILDDGRVASIAWYAEIGRKEGLALYCEVLDA